MLSHWVSEIAKHSGVDLYERNTTDLSAVEKARMCLCLTTQQPTDVPRTEELNSSSDERRAMLA